MERKNTMLLTVIAIATLLVAVVGATFAFFTATGNSSVTSDVIVTTESVNTLSATATDLVLTVALNDMLEENSGTDVVANSVTESIEITAITGNGGGVFTCSYDLNYNENAEGAYTNITADQQELTLVGTASLDTTGITGEGTATAVVTSFTEKSIGDLSGQELTLTSDDFIVTGAEQTAKLTWDITAKYYNKDYDQSAAAGNTYTGTISFDVECVTTTAE